MTTHRLDAAPDTVHWGFFDASLKPLMTVDPGDVITISTVSGAPTQMPNADSGFTVPAALPAIHKSVPQKLADRTSFRTRCRARRQGGAGP